MLAMEVCTIISNNFGGWHVIRRVSLFVVRLSITGAVLCYALVFLDFNVLGRDVQWSHCSTLPLCLR